MKKIIILSMYFLLTLTVSKAQLIKKFNGHSSNITSVKFSPDGNIMASCSEDNTIKLWYTKTNYLKLTLNGHTKKINSICFSADGTKLISASDDKTIIIWNMQTGKRIKTLYGHEHYVNSVSFSSDGNFIASGSSDKTVKIWNANIGNCVKTFTGHTDFVNSVVFSLDNRYIVSAGDDKIIKIWDVKTGDVIHSLSGHTLKINNISISPDNKYIASASSDNTIKIWNLSNGNLIQTLESHESIVTDIAFSPDAKYLASASWDETIILWNIANGTKIRSIVGTSDFINAVAFSNDGKKILSGSDNTTIQLWDVGDLNVNSEITFVNFIYDENTNNNAQTNLSIDNNIPVIDEIYKNRFALIIGNEHYVENDGLQSDVDFAIQDARIFKQYAIKTLGVPENNIIYFEDATLTKMKKGIDNFVKLMEVSPEENEFFVYYAGHGYPNEEKDAYLMPVDINAEYVEDGIKLSEFYAKLVKNNPKQVTVFIDACFSGGGRSTGLTSARSGILLKPNENTLNGNLIVFAASSENEVSKPYKDKKHGLFTYFLLKTLQESKGDITYGKLADNIIKEVRQNSITINGKQQTPRINVSKNAENVWENWKLNKTNN